MASSIPLKTVPAGELLQHLSRTEYRDEDLYFGRDGVHRYDARDGRFGMLYLAQDLPTALMESMFHNHRWHMQKRRSVALAEVQSRMVRVVGVLKDLQLADLTAPGVLVQQLGMNLEMLARRRYAATQRLSTTLHDMVDGLGKPLCDGLLYPSRNNFPATCIALFDRARRKVRVKGDIDLIDHAQWSSFVSGYRIGIVNNAGGRASVRRKR